MRSFSTLFALTLVLFLLHCVQSATSSKCKRKDSTFDCPEAHQSADMSFCCNNVDGSEGQHCCPRPSDKIESLEKEAKEFRSRFPPREYPKHTGISIGKTVAIIAVFTSILAIFTFICCDTS